MRCKMVKVLTSGNPSGASRRLRCKVVSDQVAVPSSLSKGLRRNSCSIRALCRAIAAGMAAARQIVQGGQSALIEATDQTRHSIMHAPAGCPGGFDQGHAIGDCQQGNRSLMADHGFTGSTSDSLQDFVLGFGERP